MGLIQRHFGRHAERGPWSFCWRIGVESTAVSLVAALLLATICNDPRRKFLDLSAGAVFVLLILVAPTLETLLFQALPIAVVRRFRGGMRSQILVSTAVFGAMHFPEGISVGIAAGIIGGLYYGFAYAHWRMRSLWLALAVTTGCHAIHNGIAFVGLLASGQLR